MNSNQINNVKSVEDFGIKNNHLNKIVRKYRAFYAGNTLQVVKRIIKDLGMTLFFPNSKEFVSSIGGGAYLLITNKCERTDTLAYPLSFPCQLL